MAAFGFTRWLMLVFACLVLSGLSGCSATTENLPAQRQHALQLYEQGAYPQAVQQLEELVQKIPRDADLWFRLGNGYARMGQPDAAIDSYRNALLRDPQLGKAWYNLGIIHMQQAVKAFVDMQSSVSADDPALVKARAKRDGLFRLLAKPEEKNGHE